MILCECGEIIDGNTFKDYVPTSANPSTSTMGHRNCGLIFNFIDDELPKKFSSRKELKSIAMKFAVKKGWDYSRTERLLVEVDRLKSHGNLSDAEILLSAIRIIADKEEKSNEIRDDV
jgi:hypothetical protein